MGASKRMHDSVGSDERPARARRLTRGAVEHDPVQLRIAAAWGLGRLGSQEAVALLKPILKSGRPREQRTAASDLAVRLRAEVARALVSSGNDDGIEAVWKEYQDSLGWSVGAEQRDDWFRIATTDSLALSATPVAYMKVIGILKGKDLSARWDVTRAMAEGTMWYWFQNAPAVSQGQGKLPVPALNDARVLRALMDVAEGRVAPPKTAPGFANVAKKWADEARSYAIMALRKSGNRDALAFVEKIQTQEAKAQQKPGAPTPEGGKRDRSD